MNPNELIQIIDQDEGQYSDFKLESEKQIDLAEGIMAFANAEGGHLLVGVSDDGQIVGVENVKSVVDRLHAAARRIDPSLHAAVTVEQVQYEDKIVIVAQVPEGLEATYSLSGRFKVREGSFNRLMSSADVVGHAVQRGTWNFEQTSVRQATLDDLSEQNVRDFLMRRLRTSVPGRSLDILLRDIGATILESDNTWRPTVAGLLFFGNWPQFHLSHTTILAARLIGPRGIRILDRATIEGTLPEIIDRAVQFVQRNTRHGLQIGRVDTAKALDLDEYPVEAVREAITNACCHRNYQERSPIQLKIYDDRLIVGNPGGLLPGLDVADLEGRHKSRNPLLADWLHTLGYVERFGIGLIRMREVMTQAGLPTPLLRSTPDWFEVTLLGPDQSAMDPQITTPPISSDTTSSPSTNTELRRNQAWYRQAWSVDNF